MRIRKEVMRSGKHVYIGADGKAAVKDATPTDIARWRDSGKQMLALGLPIPLPLEHDTKAHPLNSADLAADRVRNNTGFVQGFETDIIKDKHGDDIHRLISVLDIKDERTAKQVENETIPFVSPWFSTFVDGKGRKWDDVVAHVALTTRPRIADQEKFQAIPAMLSLAAPASTMPAEGICLSRAGLLKKDGKPRHLVAFSLMTGAKLSEEEIKEAEKIEDEESDGEGEAPKRKSPLDDDEPEEMDGGMPDVSIHEMIGHLLKVLGFRPPDGMSESTFERDVYETLMAKMKEMVAQKHNDGMNQNGQAGQQQMQQQRQRPRVDQESPPMYMSLEEIAKITDPEKKQMAEAMFSMQQQTEALRKNAIDKATSDRTTRIEKLLPRLPKDLRDKVQAEMATDGAKLSLDGTSGSINDPKSVYLSHMEEVASIFDKTLTKSTDNVHEQKPPQDGVMSDADAEKLANEQLKAGGRMHQGTSAA